MENDHSRPKTGGLKLVTVVVGVLALHALVIGGVIGYNYFNRKKATEPTPYTDAATTDAKTQDPDKAPQTPPVQGALGTVGTMFNRVAATLTSSTASQSPLVSPTPLPEGTKADTLPTEPSNLRSASAANSTVTAAPSTNTTEVAGSITSIPSPTPQPNTVSSEPAPVPSKTQTPSTATPSLVAYTVRKGDSLSKIAKRKHTTVARLREWNGLSSDQLKIGQSLQVPGKSSVIEPKSNSSKAKSEANKEVSTAPKVVRTKAVSQTPDATPARNQQTHVVVKGDNIYRLARQYGTTPKALMRTNQISNPTKLTVGKVLIIPGSSSRKVASAHGKKTKPAVHRKKAHTT